jgi:hypothetical protein
VVLEFVSGFLAPHLSFFIYGISNMGVPSGCCMAVFLLVCVVGYKRGGKGFGACGSVGVCGGY